MSTPIRDTRPEDEPGRDRLLDHEYDGIQEYDNPMPRWWLWIFWATILYSILYWIDVPGIGTGIGRLGQYEREVAQAEQKYGAARAAATAAVDDATLRAAAGDGARVAAGQATFATQCAVCHAADGGGGIGPNLTDGFWIHGAAPTDVHRTITNGVLEKGMPAWNQMLDPQQVLEVTAYVLTLHGTTPREPKAPQGEPAPDQP